MGSIYIRYPDGQMTQRTEEEARRLWSEGLMPNGTIYWHEGMQDWQQISEWLGEHPVVPSEPTPDQSRKEISAYHFQVDPAGLTDSNDSGAHLAGQLGVAANTVARAYRELESAAIVETRGRFGTFISRFDPTDAAMAAAAKEYVEVAKALGLTKSDAMRYLAGVPDD